MFNINRKRKIKSEIYNLFIHYQEKGDWKKAGIYAEKYLNFDKVNKTKKEKV